MGNRVQDRVTLITGGGRGIGRATAELFAAEGAPVAVTARSRDQLNEVKDTIEGNGGKALAIAADLSRREDCLRVLEETFREFGRVDILVNNAALGGAIFVLDHPDEEWHKRINLNLHAPFYLCRGVLPGMVERRWGRLISVATTSALESGVMKGSAAYCASKFAMLALTRTIALEVAQMGVTANTICPGWVNTAMSQDYVTKASKRTGETKEQVYARLASESPQNRMLEPEEVAHLALYLASEEAKGVNGEHIVIAGGSLL